jgi:histone deacetylase 1/2
VSCKYIYRLKKKAGGSLERFKARLAAKEFHQLEDSDYDETLSSIVKSTTNLVVLSLAISYEWPIRELGIYNAFFNRTFIKMFKCLNI